MDRATEIRQTAISLFAKQGYRGTSMKDIASALNIRAPSLYNHLESKQELLREVVMDTITRLRADFDRAVDEASDPVDAVRRATAVHVLMHARYPDETRIGNREIPSIDEPVRTEYLRRRAEYSDAWQALVQSGIDAGAFSVPSPKFAVFAILEMGIGVANWYRPDGELSDVEIGAYFGELALQMLGRHEGFGTTE
jgi:AcrR family transcriptional regulator